MAFAAGMGGIALLLWYFAGRWEWQVPLSWQNQMTAWRRRQSSKHSSQVLSLVWHIKDAGDLEWHYRAMRRDLSTLEVKRGSRLWIEVSLYIQGHGDRILRVLRPIQDVDFVVREYQQRGT